jgi:dynein heavy chain
MHTLADPCTHPLSAPPLTAPGTKQLIYFVDDLNMPKLDPYETAMPISLIRQHLGWGHWFDRNKLTQKNINNTQYIACMNPTAGSFVINPRLQRLFMTLAMDFPGQDSLMKIYGTFLQVGLGALLAARWLFVDQCWC